MNDKSHAATPTTETVGKDLPEPIACKPSTVETVGERLKRLYPEHYVRIITLMTEDAGAEETAQTLSSTRKYSPSIAFVWVDTAEGWHFWEELCKREHSDEA